jgi:hypothetical protein
VAYTSTSIAENKQCCAADGSLPLRTGFAWPEGTQTDQNLAWGVVPADVCAGGL